MSETCDQNCSSCGESCEERTEQQVSLKEKLHEKSRVKRVIGVVSGKGGVGKSLVTAMLATAMNRKGYRTAVLDADVTGPSIPKIFGIKTKAMANDDGLLPVRSVGGIDIMSVNLLLENDTDPVLWRGPLIGGIVKQFWSEVIWDDIDYMFIDMPPGTGDVALTVFQSLDVDGIVIVTSPQELVGMIVSKAVHMAKKMNIPILGVIENMAYFKCDNCEKEHKIFGESHVEEIAKSHGLNVLASIPIDESIAAACDAGEVESISGEWLDAAVRTIEKGFDEKEDSGNKKVDMQGEKTMKIAVASEKDQITQHFGHCEGFLIADVVDGKIQKTTFVDNPGHKPGVLPNFLNDLGVNVVIAGGMGGSAIEIFNEKGITVLTGASGQSLTAVEQYLDGTLESTGSVCHEHQHD